MIEYRESTTYTKSNCVCYEMYNNDRFSGVHIVPNEGYVIRYNAGEMDGDGNIAYTYTYGYVMIAARNMEISFPLYDTIAIFDVPEGDDV